MCTVVHVITKKILKEQKDSNGLGISVAMFYQLSYEDKHAEAMVKNFHSSPGNFFQFANLMLGVTWTCNPSGGAEIYLDT